MENNDTHNIIILINSISAASKILESHVSPFQTSIILLVSKIMSFFARDQRNTISFWHCPSKAKWLRYKLVNDQVKVADNNFILSSKHLYLMSKKKECDNIIKEWQNTFASNTKKGQYFLNFEDKEEQVIKPTYAKGSSWLPFIGFTNSLCTCFTCMTTSHAPIGEYCKSLQTSLTQTLS